MRNVIVGLPALLVALLLPGPALAAEPLPLACSTPNEVRLDASQPTVSVGQPVVLTATVTSVCESTSSHSVTISERLTGPYPAGGPEPQPAVVAVLTTPPGQVATATVTVTPQRSTDYLYGETGRAYSRSPFTTITVLQPLPPMPPPPVLQVQPGGVRRGQPVQVTAYAVGGAFDLWAARPDGTGARVIRSSTTTPTVWQVRPTEDTALFVQMRDPGATANNGRSSTHTVTVTTAIRSTVTLAATRTGTRSYRFTGTVTPAQAGLPVALYRVDGTRRVLTARGRTSTDGSYTINRQFLAGGTFSFAATTPATMSNEAGTSSTRPTAIH